MKPEKLKPPKSKSEEPVDTSPHEKPLDCCVLHWLSVVSGQLKPEKSLKLCKDSMLARPVLSRVEARAAYSSRCGSRKGEERDGLHLV